MLHSVDNDEEARLLVNEVVPYSDLSDPGKISEYAF